MIIDKLQIKLNNIYKRTYTSKGEYMKKIKFIGVIVIFLLTVLYHFLYDWLPNPVFSVFFPVNESIWEHMKLLYSGILTWGIIECFIFKYKKIKYKNFFSSLFLEMITSIMLYLIIYLPLYNTFGENMIISIGLLLIVIALEEIFSYYLLTLSKENKLLDKISIILIILGFVIFLALTYDPPKNYIFYDIESKKYGI